MLVAVGGFNQWYLRTRLQTNGTTNELPRSHMTSTLNFHKTLRKVFNDDLPTVIYTHSLVTGQTTDKAEIVFLAGRK